MNMEINSSNASFSSLYSEIENIEKLSQNDASLVIDFEKDPVKKIINKALKVIHEGELVAYILYSNKIEGVWYSPLLDQETFQKLRCSNLPLKHIFFNNYQTCQTYHSKLTEPQKKFLDAISKTLFYGVHFPGNCEATLGLNGEYVHEFPQLHPHIAIAPYNEIVFGNLFGDRTLLATVGLGDCIGLIGYDEQKKYGFVAHLGVIAICHPGFLDNLCEMIELYIAANEGNRSNLAITLCGGLIGESDEALNLLLEKIQQKKWEITSSTHLLRNTSQDKGSEVSLDITSGKINYEYNSDHSIFPSQGKEISKFSNKSFYQDKKKRIHPFVAYASINFEKQKICGLSDVISKLPNQESKEQYMHFWLLEILNSNHAFTSDDLRFVINHLENLGKKDVLMIWQILLAHDVILPEDVLLKLKDADTDNFESLYGLLIEKKQIAAIQNLIDKNIPFPLTLIAELDELTLVYILERQSTLIERTDQNILIELADRGQWEKIKILQKKGKALDKSNPELDYLHSETKNKLIQLFSVDN